jgi:hypothetical protein
MQHTRFWSVTWLLIFSLLAGCKPSRDISGAWFGTLDAGHLKLRLVLHIKREGNGYKATLDTIDQGRAGLPVSGVKVKGSDVHVDLSTFNAVYDTRLNSDATEMTGLFRQFGANIPFTMKRTAQPPAVAPPLLPAAYTPRAGSDLQGYWLGSLSVANVQSRLAFKIAEPSAGRFRGELDSIDQGATGIPVSAVAYQPPNVRLEVAGVAGLFEGTLDRKAGEMSGTWRQGPNNLPITLKRSVPPTSEAANYTFVKETDPQGSWTGSLDAKGATLRLGLRIGKLSNGSYVAKLDSPDQGSTDIPATSMKFTPPSSINVEWKALRAGYQAQLKGGKLVGTWTQSGQSFPFTMQRDKNAK